MLKITLLIDHILDRSLMIGWRKNPETLKDVLCIHFRVCLSVCTQVTEHIFWSRNLIFGMSDPWDMRKKHIFLFFEIFISMIFIGIFRCFLYITLVFFCFQLSVTFFHLGMSYLGLENLVPLEIEDFWLFWKFIFLRLKGSFFSFFGQFFKITLMILEISMACHLSF